MMRIFTRQLLITSIPSIIILSAMVMVSIFFQVPTSFMTRDVTAIANMHPLSGILSNLGVLLWCVSASICGFSAIALRNNVPRDTFLFLLYSSLLSAYLMFDDLFLFHEDLAFRYLGLSEKYVFVALGILVFAYLIVLRQTILRTDISGLLFALGFFAASIAVDVIFEPWLVRLDHWSFLLEDGIKWLGIANWCSYYIQTSYRFLAGAVKPLNNTMQ